jgi:hypothetical protein
LTFCKAQSCCHGTSRLASRPSWGGLIGRLTTACLTAVMATHFVLRLLPMFSCASIWAALLPPDFQGAQPDSFFSQPLLPVFLDPFLPIRHYDFLWNGDAGQGSITLKAAV